MNTNNVKLGPCNVYIDGADIGSTKGGVTVSLEYEMEQSKLLGASPNYDMELIATRATVSIPFAESTLENLSIITPWNTLKINNAKRLVTIKNERQYIRDYAAEIKLIPINSSSDNEVVTIHKAIPTTAPSLIFNLQQRIYEVVFKALEVSATDKTLISFGDITA